MEGIKASFTLKKNKKEKQPDTEQPDTSQGLKV